MLNFTIRFHHIKVGEYTVKTRTIKSAAFILAAAMVIMAVAFITAPKSWADAQSDWDSLTLSLTGSQKVKTAYANTSDKMVIVFSAKWSDDAKLTNLTNEGWTFNYVLKDSAGKEWANSAAKTGLEATVGSGKTYFVEVTATIPAAGGDPTTATKKTEAVKFTFPGNPSKLETETKKTSNNVSLKWKKGSNATGYLIYRGTKKKTRPAEPTKQLKESKTEYVDENLAGKKTYYYWIQATYTSTDPNFKYTSASTGFSNKANATVEKYLTCKIRTMTWITKTRSSSKVYEKMHSNKVIGTIKKGKKVTAIGYTKAEEFKNPARVMICLRNKAGEIIMKGWVPWAVVKKVNGVVAYDSKTKTGLDYTKERKEEYVNSKGYASSTKYMIWCNLYTQRVNIFKGSKGKWKLIKTGRCTSGRFAHGTKKSDSMQIDKKKPFRERISPMSNLPYYYNYLSYFNGGNSFHTPCYRSGTTRFINSVKSSLQPGTQGCVRCTVEMAKYIYNNVPLNTRVVVF